MARIQLDGTTELLEGLPFQSFCSVYEPQRVVACCLSRIQLYSPLREHEGTATIWATSGSGIGEASVTVLATPQIAFVRDSEIYVMAVDGSNQVNLTDNAADDGGPTWSPDGYRIAFNSNRDGNDEIYMMNANGSNVVRLTDNIDRDVSPAWWAGIRQIAFQSFRDGNPEIYLMIMDGDNLPSYLPYTDEDGPSPGVRVFELNNLPNDPSSDGSPAWSPGGGQIAFQRDASEIYVMEFDGSFQMNLTNHGAIDDDPAWSPDGSQIAFRSNRDGNEEIYVMDYFPGSNVTNVVRLTNNTVFDGGPAWSPDGSQIAFRSSRDGNDEIYVMDADGSNVVRLTNNAVFDGSPAWSPDRCC